MRRFLFLAVIASLALPVAAQRCDTAIADADEQYRSGFFDEAIERLTDCLDRNAFTAEERRRAYRLLGLAYIGKDREADARRAVQSLLEVAPDYRPDPNVDPPPFVEMVTEVRRTRPRPSGGPGPYSTGVVSSTSGFMGGFSLLGTGYSDSDGDNASGAGGSLTLGYGLTPALAVQLQLAGSSFSDFGDYVDDITGLPVTVTGTLGTFGLGGRLHIGGGARKLVPFVGAGGSFQTLSLDFLGDFSGPGGNVEGGVLYFFSPSLALDTGLQALFSSLSANGHSYSATTVNIGVGISWSPGR